MIQGRMKTICLRPVATWDIVEVFGNMTPCAACSRSFGGGTNLAAGRTAIQAPLRIVRVWISTDETHDVASE